MIILWGVCFIVLTMASVLTLMGRNWWCSCGRYNLYVSDGLHYCQHLFDAWTVTHLGHGVFIYGCWRGALFAFAPGVAILATLAVEALWELLENTPWVIAAYRHAGDKDYQGDSIANALGDFSACAIGALFTSLFV